jgi:DNA-binding MarR family transcriptional regulator
MSISSDSSRDLIILENLEQNPDATQASLAAQLGVAVGTINWHLKRLIEKGYLKARRIERRKLMYFITPEGVALRARLTVDYIQTSFELYRLVRERMTTVIDQVCEAGYNCIRLEGDGDVAEICRLTCLEHQIVLTDNNEKAPLVKIHGFKLFVYLDGEEAEDMLDSHREM